MTPYQAEFLGGLRRDYRHYAWLALGEWVGAILAVVGTLVLAATDRSDWLVWLVLLVGAVLAYGSHRDSEVADEYAARISMFEERES